MKQVLSSKQEKARETITFDICNRVIKVDATFVAKIEMYFCASCASGGG